MNFIAIDFETANHKRNSACALGLAVVTDGKLSATREWRFRPLGFSFNSTNVRLHGITEEPVANSPTFAAAWDEILPYFEHFVIVAHYATFDISVLQHSLDSHGIAYPAFDYTCTWLIAKETWPSFHNFTLQYVSSRLGLARPRHNPLSDAQTCAEVVQAACNKWQVTSLEQLESCTNIARGSFSAHEHMIARRR